MNKNIDLTLILKIGGIVFALISLYMFLKVLPQILLVLIFAGIAFLIFPEKALIKSLYRTVKNYFKGS